MFYRNLNHSNLMLTDMASYSLIFLDRYPAFGWSTVDSTVISLAAELAERNIQ